MSPPLRWTVLSLVHFNLKIWPHRRRVIWPWRTPRRSMCPEDWSTISHYLQFLILVSPIPRLDHQTLPRQENCPISFHWRVKVFISTTSCPHRLLSKIPVSLLSYDSMLALMTMSNMQLRYLRTFGTIRPCRTGLTKRNYWNHSRPPGCTLRARRWPKKEIPLNLYLRLHRMRENTRQKRVPADMADRKMSLCKVLCIIVAKLPSRSSIVPDTVQNAM